MTTTAFIAICPRHKIVARVETLQPGTNNFHCPECGRLTEWTRIEGKTGTGKCDSRCWDSIRGKCKCVCGGVHHATTFGVFERAS